MRRVCLFPRLRRTLTSPASLASVRLFSADSNSNTTQTFDYSRSNTENTKSKDIVWSEGLFTTPERIAMTGRRGGTIWLTGLSGSGKSTIACALEDRLLRNGHSAYRLDGDNVRFGLNKDLGFSDKDRDENIRRIGEVAKLFSDSGMIAITAFISPYRAARNAVRGEHVESNIPFIEVHTEVSLAVAEARDPKGLYKKARAGELKNFTGIDDPYEEPTAPEIVVVTDDLAVNESVDKIIAYLEEHKFI